MYATQKESLKSTDQLLFFKMVLESLFSPFAVKKKPWEMFFVGLFYSFVSVFLAYVSFPEQSGLLTVFFIVMCAIPLIYTAIKNEEEIDLKVGSEIKLLKEHAKVISFLMYFFIGVVVALSIVYVVLPSSMVEIIFSVQSQAILDVNNNVSGNVTKIGLFSGILFNNLKVLIFCLVFSFLFGVGAIFILTWNASVIAVAVGNLIKSQIANVGAVSSSVGLTEYFAIGTFSFMRYMFHGAIEIAAYFIVGLAGSIISIAVIKHNLTNKRVLYDAIDLIIISILIIIFAAVVEVFVTPMFFST